MATTPEEVEVKVQPILDWSKIYAMADSAGGTLTLLSKASCGHCGFFAQSVDPDVVERLHDVHECTPAAKPGPPRVPPRWHESLADSVDVVIRCCFYIAAVYLIVSWLAEWPLPWTS